MRPSKLRTLIFLVVILLCFLMADVPTGAQGPVEGSPTAPGTELEDPLGVQTDLSVTKTDSPDPVTAGDNLTYVIEVANAGPDDATGVVLTDTLPDGVTFDAVVIKSAPDPAASCSESGGTATCNLGAMGANESATIEITVTVDPSVKGNITNTASVTGDQTDPEIGNNTATENTLVVTGPDLEATKSDSLAIDADGDGVPSPGDTLLYTINIANHGDASALATFLDDIPDANTTLVAGSVSSTQGTVITGNNAGDTTVQVDIGSIPGGGTVTVSFSVTIVDPLPAGVTQVANQGVVSGDNFPSVLTDDPDTPSVDDPTMTTVTAAPALAASKTDALLVDADGDGVASPGDTLLYEITLINSGNTSATGVAFNDTPDSNTILIVGSVQTSRGTVTRGNTTGDTSVEVDVGTISGSGDSVTISFQVTINDPLPAGVVQVANQGTVTSNELPAVPTDDPATGGTTDPTVTPVTAAPVLSASKTDTLFTDADGDGAPSPGDVLLYQIVIRNSGNQAASVAFLDDIVDPNTTLVPGSVQTTLGTVTRGNSAGDTSVQVDIGTVPGGGDVTISFRVTIVDPLPAGVTQVANQGVVTSNDVPSVLTDDPTVDGPTDPTVTPVTAAPFLSASKADSLFADADGDAMASPGDTLAYVVDIFNTGNQEASGVTFRDTPDSNTALVVGSVQTNLGTVVSGNTAGDVEVEVDVGTIPGGGGVAHVSFRVTINDPLPADVTQVANRGVVTGDNFPDDDEQPPTDDPDTPDEGDKTETPVFIHQPGVAVDKVLESGDPAFVAELVHFTIRITNTGNTTLVTVPLTDTYDAEYLAFASAVPAPDVVMDDAGQLVWNDLTTTFGDLAPGNAITVPVVMTATQFTPQGVKAQNRAIVENVVDEFGETPPGVGDQDSVGVTVLPNIAISKRANVAGAVRVGEEITFTIQITNITATDIVRLPLDDEYDPDFLGFMRADPSPDQFTSGSVTWDDLTDLPPTGFGTSLAPDESFSVSIVFTALAPVDPITNTAIVENAVDANGNPVSGFANAPVSIGVPAIEAAKTSSLFVDADGSGAPSPGDTLLYEVAITNSGNAAASGVVFRDTPDPNTTLVVGSVQTSQGAVTSGNSAGDASVEVDVGTIPGGGGTTEVSFRVTINDPLPAGVTQVANQGVVTGGNFPDEPTDDPDTPDEDDDTETPIRQPGVAVDKVLESGDTAFVAELVHFTIRITNTGNTTLVTVPLTDTYDAEYLAFASAVPAPDVVMDDAGQLVWNDLTTTFGDLAPGNAITVPVVMTATHFTPQGVKAQNRAIVENVVDEFGETPPGDGDEGTVGVTILPNIAADKADSLAVDADGDGNASPGDTLLYEITITNNGDADATEVTFSDTPDSNTTLVVGSVQTGQGTVTSGNSPGDTGVAVDIGTIPVGGSVNISFQVTINDPWPAGVTQVANQGVVSGDNFPDEPTDDPTSRPSNDPTITPISVPPVAGPRPVGGYGEPLSATETLAPWLILTLVIAVGAFGVLALRRRTGS